MIGRGRVFASMLLLAGCDSSSSGTSLVGPLWQSANTTTGVAVAIEFSASGSYEQQELELTSDSSGELQAETGSYVLSESTITLTPQQWTCPGPYPVYSMTYTFSGGDLVLSSGSVINEYQVDTSSSAQVSITEGCFESTGFVEEALAPVSQ